MSSVFNGPGNTLASLSQADQLTTAPSTGRLVAASNDDAAVELFLAEYANSPNTQRAYAREVHRFVLWVRLQGKRLALLTREDFARYSDFLGDPQPREVWCGPKRGRHGQRMGPNWRPFTKPLGPSAHRTALIILNSFMNYLVQARYLQGNPLALIRQRSRLTAPMAGSRRRIQSRCLDDEQWGLLLDHVDKGCAQPHTAELYERTRFVIALMYFLALRIGEIANHTMGAFVQLRDRWYFDVVGKGNKLASIPVGDEMLAALQRYRHHLGLSALPAPGEALPLLLNMRGNGCIGARRVNQVIKKVLAKAAAALEEDQPHKAAHMRNASAHWFRHTSLTRQAQKGIHFSHLQANARHARLDTTMLYVHLDDDLRHAEIAKHTWR